MHPKYVYCRGHWSLLNIFIWCVGWALWIAERPLVQLLGSVHLMTYVYKLADGYKHLPLEQFPWVLKFLSKHILFNELTG